MSGEAPTFRVYIRDYLFRRVAELTDWISFDFVSVLNEVGTWRLETSSENAEARLLLRSGGVIVTREIDGVESTIFSGFVWTEWGFTARTFRAAGYCDNALLWTPARPTPSQAEPPWPDEYDVRTATASTVMRTLVLANIGSFAPPVWRVAPIYFPTDPLLGTTITSRARLQPMLTLLRELALTPYAGGLGFHLRQSDAVANSLEFTVYAPPDKSADAKFSIDLNTISDYEDIRQAPEANVIYVMGGDGFGSNRTVLVYEDGDSITEWGRRIATVIDERGTVSPSELNQRAAEALAGIATRRRVAVTPFTVPSLRYGDDYDLGTLVTLVTHSGETVDLIRRVEVSFDPESGPQITPIVGEGDGSDEEQTAAITRTIQGRLSNLERNWTVPPDGIDRSMLTPVLKPTIGKVEWLAHSTVPSGWLLANGQVVSRATYAALFALLGTTWNTGGETGAQFRLPNLIDRSPIGSGSTYTLGQYYGAASVNLAHQHTGAPHTHSHAHSGAAHTHSHTHTGPPHTHPGSHQHGPGIHQHNTDVDHDHPNITSSLESAGAAALSVYPTGPTTNVGHTHNVNLPALGSTVKTSSGPSANDTAADSSAPAASFSGATGSDATGASAANTGTDATAASFSGSTGSGGSGTQSVLHPSAALLPVIYAGV